MKFIFVMSCTFFFFPPLKILYNRVIKLNPLNLFLKSKKFIHADKFVATIVLKA